MAAIPAGTVIGVAGSGLYAAQGIGLLAGGSAAGKIGPQATVALAGGIGVTLAVTLSIAWLRVWGAQAHLALEDPAQSASRDARNVARA